MTSEIASPVKQVLQRKAASPLLVADAHLHHGENLLHIVFGLACMLFIGWLDLESGGNFSLSLFYVLPVAIGSRRCGFASGILLSLAGSVVWWNVDARIHPNISPLIGVWNGIVRFSVLTLISSLVYRLQLGVRRERLLAGTDALTGAANSRTFYQNAAIEADRASRTIRPMTIAYLDLDNFKQLNDRLGHSVGDAALIQVVSSVQQHLRRTDLLARLGGDEFALLLPETDAEGSLTLLNRLQKILSDEMARNGWPVTLSIGAITFLRPSVDIDLMIRQVDVLMYTAKKKGKARIEHETNRDIPGMEEEARRRIERRATTRVTCEQPARVRLNGPHGVEEEPAMIHDISAGGLSFSLHRKLLPETRITVEPLSRNAVPLQGRIVRVSDCEEGYEHGCELSLPLTSEELCGWLMEALESVEA